MTELSNVVIVVGDRFHVFAENASIVTVGDARKMLVDDGTRTSGEVLLLSGLGIEVEVWEQLTAELAAEGVPDSGVVLAPPPRPIPCAEALKIVQKNVLLANLHSTGESTFRAELVVAAETEMILDHTAERQHIPGLLLMEACCQMFVAATRRFLERQRPDREYYAVMQKFNIEFRHFVFPLPTHLELTIESWDAHDEERPLFTSAIDIIQGGAVCAQARWTYRAFRPDRIFATETAQAGRAIAAVSQT